LRKKKGLRIFESRVLRRIFGPKREEDGSWRKLHNDELHSLYSSPKIVRVIRSRSMRWVGHVACIEKGRGSVFTVFWMVTQLIFRKLLAGEESVRSVRNEVYTPEIFYMPRAVSFIAWSFYVLLVAYILVALFCFCLFRV
jgi:hypothetical protein